MAWDEEKAHGQVEEIVAVPEERLQRPLTTAEKLAATKVDVSSSHGSSSQRDSDEPSSVKYHGVFAPVYNSAVRFDNSVLSRLRDFEALMDKKLGVESEAIDRKLPEERQHVTLWQSLTMALLWASGVLNLSCFATGFLGQEFQLTLAQNILCCVFGSLLGGAVSGFCATLGPGTGLRQISIGRYSMGWYPNKIIAALNTVQQLGWSAVGCITGGLALTAISNGSVSIAVGIIIIAVLSLCVSFVGLRAILVYERYAWLVYVIIFIIIYAMTGPYADTRNYYHLEGSALASPVLNLLAIVYGSSASWATIASDYYVHYPVNTSRTKVFVLTTLGIALPTAFGMVAGAVVSSAFTATRPDWATADGDGLGYVVLAMLHPRGFAKFILVLLVLSGINCNILNTYSAAISCQQFSRPFARLPRFAWTIACFGVIIALALAGRNHLLTYLQDFLALLGYWCTTYFVIVFSEHYFFRKNRFENYDLEGWNDPARLPIGVAGFTAFALGVVAWVMGMVETWYTGPLGKLIGGGGDVANEFAFGVALLSYYPVRYWELKRFGR